VQASLLIVDSIATNRVALKVKLAAAWYDVSVAATGVEALTAISQTRPNLVLINNTLPDMHVAEVSARLKAQLGKDAPPLLALTEAPEAREALLRSGVEDVLPLPVDDMLLLARIRSVLRNHATEAEWRLRDGTSRALGFAEPTQLFARPVEVMCLHAAHEDRVPFLYELSSTQGLSLQAMHVGQAMCDLTATQAASVIILSLSEDAPETVLSILSDLRANPKTRHAAIMVAAPEGRSDLAARALDLGADDATVAPVPTSEIALRVRRLHTRREIQEGLRAMVRNGAEAALRDPLTSLYNRRYALPHMERIAEQSRISGKPFAVMIADLDHFKRINDWYGHKVGDAVLVECARRLQKNMRAGDLVARIGGEEFLVVLPNTNRADARQAALRLCQRISNTSINLPDRNTAVDVTISIGLALSGESDAFMGPMTSVHATPADLLSRADKALYQAKEMGRNRYILERSQAA